MSRELFFKVKQFLSKEQLGDAPILVAVSGGGDSLALLHLLSECGCRLQVAHVNHGWRQESIAEAQAVEAWAQELSLPFHFKQLHMDLSLPNHEERARDLRWEFLLQVAKEQQCQAIALGHHREDQGETVLKRVLEGSSFVNLSGMLPVSEREGIQLWRPLLALSKKQLARYLEKKQLTPYEDVSNQDCRYLRPRLRQTILPFLEKTFGKCPTDPLCRLGEQVSDLKEHVRALVSALPMEEVKGPWGALWDWSEVVWLGTFHAQVALQSLVSSGWSHQSLKGAALALLKGKAQYELRLKGKRVVIDRGRIFFFKECASFEVIWRPVEKIRRCSGEGWKAVWQGSVTLPPGKVLWGSEWKLHPMKRRLSERRTASKVPACLRAIAPVVLEERGEVHDSLSSLGQGRKEGERVWRAFFLSH